MAILIRDVRVILTAPEGINLVVVKVETVHERIRPIDAIGFAKELEKFDLFFLEDAIPLDQGEWLRQLRAQTSIPLAQGELFNNSYEWKYLITERLIDYIRVHISQIGGITPARKLQIFAEEFGVKTAWHGPGDMSPELKGPREALLDVFSGLPEYKQGYVYANDKPGLGIDINETEAAKYPCENTVTTWTQTRLRDGTLQTP